MPVVIPWLKVGVTPKAIGNGGKDGGSFGGKDAGGKGFKSWTPNYWAGAKSYGKGGKGKSMGGNRYPRKPPQSVPESFHVDPEARFKGTVKFWRTFSGYGFVDLVQQGVTPDNAQHVHWRAIQTEDRYPQLAQGMEVELSISKIKDRRSGAWTLKATNVTAPGGALLCVQDEEDAKSKEFVGGQHLRYTGQLQYFNPRRGFGWLTMDDGYALTEPVPKELRVDRLEVNAGGRQPVPMKELAVEFGIMRAKNGGYKAYNMTLPGGIPMTLDGLEHRVVLGNTTFSGTVDMYNWQRGWGFIRVAEGVSMPPAVVAKVKKMQEDAKQRGKNSITGQGAGTSLYFRKTDINEGVTVDKGMAVSFKVYTDDKGAGACEIRG
eukprot:CAMPEP_0204529958 /NCGR_PEP_ID=MMETSP0661-20131031/10351_1 /ASSEMBLY_ACC=CAM_ASM_000606 /TAXON_ID=109239 /ORGANISM="Alexandrium margalefi, Strain AMGDE01CS-322" /LENGTH=375 /DNA_ID=CAMNT_0051536013 /DNA_START=68 /DNA_END=1195 /DNA_ORIENTATION=+